jgi:hypothetical protein
MGKNRRHPKSTDRPLIQATALAKKKWALGWVSQINGENLMSFHFHAQVDDDAIRKVSRLFNASLLDILNELLQNARRSGATTVRIGRSQVSGMGDAISVSDDGPGISDPKTLFSLGRSEWNEQVTTSEDAAGMGFFALANRGARIIAQSRGTDQSWLINASPEAFSGEVAITGEAGPTNFCGLTILFPQLGSENLTAVAQQAARYCPLEVILEGEVLEQKDFLGGGIYTEEWHGMRIGVFLERSQIHSRPGHNTNFHGVTLHVPLPELHQEFHQSFYARVDVERCSDLKLVLPARKEVVQDEFLEQLRLRILRIYYQLIINHREHSLAWNDYNRGREMGIDLPEAARLLRPFTPDQADHHQNHREIAVTVEPGGILYIESEGAVEEQNVARAIEQSPEMGPVYEPLSTYIGYEWYEEMTRFKLQGYGASVDGEWLEVPAEERVEFNDRPDCLAVLLEVSGRHKALTLETDVLVLAEEYTSIDEANVHVTATSDVTPDALTSFLQAALFSPSDDAEAGSYDQQLQWFTDEAEDLSVQMLVSSMAAEKNWITRVLRREITWRLPKDCQVSIEIKDREVSITGTGFPEDEGSPF